MCSSDLLRNALVGEFWRHGWHVAAGWHRHRPAPPDATVLTVPLDVRDSTAARTAVECVLSAWGRLDVLVNNAGIARDAPVPSLPDSDWQDVLEVNLRGPFLCSQAALRPMLAQGDGHILNIASFGGRVGRAGQSNYAASKAGLLGLTQSLAREVGASNIRVNAVLPGFLRTGMTGELTETQLATHAAANALGRLNDLGEVARMVVFLAGMRNISGQLFQLDSRIVPWT